MENITVGIDNEAASQTAVDWVIERARTRDVSIHLVTAYDMLVSNPEKDGKVLASTRHRIEKAVPGTEVETVLVQRSIMEELVDMSSFSDLLVIGSHPEHPVLSALTGALPVGLAARTECPIVIVPDGWSHRDGAIVAGVDSDDSSVTAVQFAGREAWEHGLALELVHTWNLAAPAISPVEVFIEDPKETKELHRSILSDSAQQVASKVPGVEVHAHLVQGIAAVELAERARQASLLVIGSHGWGPISGFFLGSVGQEVLRHSRVPVCIVPLDHPARQVTDIPTNTAALS